MDPLVEVPNVPRRKRRRERVQEVRHVSKFLVSSHYPATDIIFTNIEKKNLFSISSFLYLLQILKATIQRGIIIVLIVATIFVSAYYGRKGIFWLSDRMNEVDEQRLRRRGTHPRFY